MDMFPSCLMEIQIHSQQIPVSTALVVTSKSHATSEPEFWTRKLYLLLKCSRSKEGKDEEGMIDAGKH